MQGGGGGGEDVLRLALQENYIPHTQKNDTSLNEHIQGHCHDNISRILELLNFES